MELASVIHIGIIFNAIVCSIVTISAGLLAFFLLKRWNNLSQTMKAYTWFWIMTTFIWLPLSVRYFMVGFGAEKLLFYLALMTQAALSLCGPPLIYYLATNLRQSRTVALFLTAVVLIIAFIGIWYDFQPNGLIMSPVTYFSAEVILNTVSLYLYIGAISIIFLFMLVDIITHGIDYLRYKKSEVGYETLYSLAIAAYLVLGSLEVIAMITDWMVVVFRVFYIGTFLTVYMIIKNHEETLEQYFIEKKTR